MASRWHSIGAEAHRALTTSAAYDGPRVIITDELELPAWQQVKTVLETLGAVYVVGASAFGFEPDQNAPADRVGAARAGWSAGRGRARVGARVPSPEPSSAAGRRAVYEHGAGRRLEADAFAESGIPTPPPWCG
jgi:hypothetical protein